MRILIFTHFLLFFITTLSTTSAEDVACECTISNVPFLYFKLVKTCTVKSKFTVTKANTTVISLNGKKPTDEPNKDASFFFVFGKTVNYIPKGLDKLFANLTGMRFELTRLKHVTKENLAPFPQLLMFASVSNQVQFIEQDLFVNNPNLKYVSFRSNKITYIEPTVFDSLRPSLVQLYIDGTAITCGFPQATTNSAVGKVLDKLKDSACSDIDNAPPLYSFWLEKQGGSKDNDSDCEDEKAAKDVECDAKITEEKAEFDRILESILACSADPKPADCSTPEKIRSLLRKN